MEKTESLKYTYMLPLLFILAIVTMWFFIPSTQSILIMLGLLSFLVIAHELGHFTVARWAGVKVERFGFGLPFGPTLYEKQIGDVTYCVHALLLGGYVSFADDNPENGLPADSPELLENKPILWRIAVYSAGIVVNTILSYLILFLVFANWGQPVSGTRIEALVSSTAPAAIAGLKANDLIISVTPPNGERLTLSSTLDPGYFNKAVEKNIGKPLALEILRDGTTIQTKVTPNTSGHIGVKIHSDQIFKKVSSPLEIITGAHQYITKIIAMQGLSIKKLLSGEVSPKELSGPVGIVKMGGEAIASGGIQYGLLLTSIISMMLAISNLLPIPALDGGWLLFAFIEIVRGGKPLKKEIQNGLMQVFFIILLGLMGLILVNDILSHTPVGGIIQGIMSHNTKP